MNEEKILVDIYGTKKKKTYINIDPFNDSGLRNENTEPDENDTTNSDFEDDSPIEIVDDEGDDIDEDDSDLDDSDLDNDDDGDA